MRTHRPHRKSRKGCITCKTRRVKCDERQPTCGSCAFRKTKCVYQDSTRSSTEPEYDVHASSSNARPISDCCKQHWGDSERPSIGLAGPNFFNSLPKAPKAQRGCIPNPFLISEYFSRASPGIVAADLTEKKLAIWTSVIPGLAIQHEVVSHAMLAVSALSICEEGLTKHLSNQLVTGCSSERRGVVSDSFRKSSRPILHQAEHHFVNCLNLLQKDIGSINQQNVDAVMCCSLLLIPYGLSYAQLERHCIRNPNKERASPSPTSSAASSPSSPTTRCSSPSGPRQVELNLSWIKFVGGLAAVIQSIKHRDDWLESAMMPLFDWSDEGHGRALWPTLTSRTKGCNDPHFMDHPMFQTIITEGPSALARLRQRLEALHHRHEPAPGQMADPELYLKALGQLESVTKQVTAFALAPPPQPFRRVLMIWPANINGRFLGCLEQGDIVALAVYAHFLAYIILDEDLWWIGDLGIGSLRDIVTMLDDSTNADFGEGQIPVEDLELFEWPRRIVELHETLVEYRQVRFDVNVL